MAGLSLDALEDKVRISVLCRLLMRKGLLTYDEFEEMVLRSVVVEKIENLPAEKFNQLKWKLFEVLDPENKTGWKEKDDRKKGTK